MTKEQAINTAARWWVNTLKKKQRHSNGDDSMSSILACAMADILREDISDDQFAIFEKELKQRVEADIEKYIIMHRFNHTELCCDYSPCLNLMEAAKIAAISEHNFPYKTNMMIRVNRANECDFSVEVSDGYAQPYQTLCPVE